MRHHQRADGERVLDDGHGPVGLAARELELNSNGAERAGGSLAGLHDRQGRRVGQTSGRCVSGGGHVRLLSAGERSGWIQRGSAADKYGQRECTAVIVESWPEKTTWRSVGPPARFRPGCPRVDLVLVLPGFVKCWAGRVKQDGGCDSVEREAGLLVQGTDSASRRRLAQAEACVLGRQEC